MTITNVSDFIKQSLSKLSDDDIIKNLKELKENDGITKIKDFDKIMYYFMKSKTFMKYIYVEYTTFKYIEIFEYILNMHPNNGIYDDEQMLYLCERGILNKLLLEKLINKGYILKYEHIVAYLSKIMEINKYNHIETMKSNIRYIIQVFVNRKNIDEKEYVDISKYQTICNDSGYILFDSLYFQQTECVNLDENDKNYIKKFIEKFNFFYQFYDRLMISNDVGIVLPFFNVNWDIKNNIIQKYYKNKDIYDIKIFEDFVKANKFYEKLIGLDFYEILLDPIFKWKFESRYKQLDTDLNSKFICNFYYNFEFYVAQNIHDKYIEIFDYYNQKFDNVIDKLKNINNKITLNKELINSDFCDGICKKYDIKKINMGDINESTKNININLFQIMYSGDYNTELLNKCVKLKFNKETINFLLITKRINFDNETLRYAIYTQNLDVITHMLDNKYIGNDTDLLHLVDGGQFKTDLCNLYKKYNILISDNVYKELRMRNLEVNYQYCINGHDTNHMYDLDEQIKSEKLQIFPFNTYNSIDWTFYYDKAKTIDWTFYYDKAKKGELTLEMITKIHHVVGATGIQHLLRLYMEFNKNNTNVNIDTTDDNKIENKPKKIIKKIVKKVKDIQ